MTNKHAEHNAIYNAQTSTRGWDSIGNFLLISFTIVIVIVSCCTTALLIKCMLKYLAS